MATSQFYRYFVLEPGDEGPHGAASRAALRCYADHIKAHDFPMADALHALLADEEPIASPPDEMREPVARPEHTLSWVLDTLRVASSRTTLEAGWTWGEVELAPITEQTGIERTALRFKCDVLSRQGLFRWDYSAPGVRGWVRLEDKKSSSSGK